MKKRTFCAGRPCELVLLLAVLSALPRALPPVVATVSTTIPGPLHVGITSIPLYGHIKPVQVIGEEFLRRGHYVTYFLEDSGTRKWCDVVREAGGLVDCVTLPSHGLFSTALFEELSANYSPLDSLFIIIEEIVRHHDVHIDDFIAALRKVHDVRPISLLVKDASTLVGYSAADALGIPRITFNPMTTLPAMDVNSHVPMMGTGWPERMSTGQRLRNVLARFFIQVAPPSNMPSRISAARVARNITSIRSRYDIFGLDDVMFTPTLWGLDIPQELCPNVHPLGILAFREDRTPSMENALATFLDGCTAGAVYVNFGTLSVPREDQLDRIARALLRTPHCIVWKMLERQRLVMMERYFREEANRTYISSHFVSPVKIMKHGNVVAFLSHCGDTSILESLDARLPVVGIPLLSDQADVCQRLEEAGVGKSLRHKNHFTSEDLVGAIHSLTADAGVIRSRIDKLRQISKFLGGAEKAVDIVESYYHGGLLGQNVSFHRCVMLHHMVNEDPVRVSLIDVFAIWMVFMVLLWLLLFGFVAKLCRYARTPAAAPQGEATENKRRRFRALSRSIKEKDA